MSIQTREEESRPSNEFFIRGILQENKSTKQVVTEQCNEMLTALNEQKKLIEETLNLIKEFRLIH